MKRLDELHSFAAKGGKLSQSEKAWIKNLCQQAGVDCKPSRCPSFWSDKIDELRCNSLLDPNVVDDVDNLDATMHQTFKLKQQFADGVMINGRFIDQTSMTAGIYAWMCKLGLSHMFIHE